MSASPGEGCRKTNKFRTLVIFNEIQLSIENFNLCPLWMNRPNLFSVSDQKRHFKFHPPLYCVADNNFITLHFDSRVNAGWDSIIIIVER